MLELGVYVSPRGNDLDLLYLSAACVTQSPHAVRGYWTTPVAILCVQSKRCRRRRSR